MTNADGTRVTQITDLPTTSAFPALGPQTRRVVGWLNLVGHCRRGGVWAVLYAPAVLPGDPGRARAEGEAHKTQAVTFSSPSPHYWWLTTRREAADET